MDKAGLGLGQATHIHHLCYNHFRGDAGEATIVAVQTGFVAKYRAGATIQILYLNGILSLLSISHESTIGMGGSPDGDYRSIHQ